MIIIKVLFIILFGSIGHFIYDLSGGKKWAEILFSKNESTWEHIKLALLPTFLVIIFNFIFLYNTFFASFIFLLSEIILIPALFYGYQLITKKNYFILDILDFVLSIIISYKLYNLALTLNISLLNLFGLIGIILIIYMFLTFAIYPPNCFLFKEKK